MSLWPNRVRWRSCAGPLSDFLLAAQDPPSGPFASHVDSWVDITVTDDRRPEDMRAQLLTAFPICCRIGTSRRDGGGLRRGLGRGVTANASPLAVIKDFVTEVAPGELDPEELAVLEQVTADVFGTGPDMRLHTLTLRGVGPFRDAFTVDLTPTATQAAAHRRRHRQRQVDNHRRDRVRPLRRPCRHHGQGPHGLGLPADAVREGRPALRRVDVHRGSRHVPGAPRTLLRLHQPKRQARHAEHRTAPGATSQ